MKINPIFFKDYYKSDHVSQYPPGTTMIYSNFTPRKSRMPGVDYSVFFGLRYFIDEYLEKFKTEFFDKPFDEIGYQTFMNLTLGNHNSYDHIKKLHELGYLPICILALPEGTIVPCGVPALVMWNTHPDFFWVTNMLETLLSCTLWGPCTSATIAREYRKILQKYTDETSDIPEFVDYQAHDFSMRGMSSLESAVLSGMGHLTQFKGTDNIPAIIAATKYYNRDIEQIASIPATEHSVASSYGEKNEIDYYKRLLTEVYPTGMVSIVADTYDFFRVIDEYLPYLKDIIMKREGTCVLRPDSGVPEDIICGINTTHWSYPDTESSEAKGLIERLWEIFGGTINSKGYKQLDHHIGAIYGDSITLERAEEICRRLKEKGFASTNIVFGVGSYSYQMNTRDTLGWAVKATCAQINGEYVPITKNPKTDDGTKKSHSGFLKVVKGEDGKLKVIQNCDEAFMIDNLMKVVYSPRVIDTLYFETVKSNETFFEIQERCKV